MSISHDNFTLRTQIITPRVANKRAGHIMIPKPVAFKKRKPRRYDVGTQKIHKTFKLHFKL